MICFNLYVLRNKNKFCSRKVGIRFWKFWRFPKFEPKYSFQVYSGQNRAKRQRKTCMTCNDKNSLFIQGLETPSHCDLREIEMRRLPRAGHLAGWHAVVFQQQRQAGKKCQCTSLFRSKEDEALAKARNVIYNRHKCFTS